MIKKRFPVVFYLCPIRTSVVNLPATTARDSGRRSHAHKAIFSGILLPGTLPSRCLPHLWVCSGIVQILRLVLSKNSKESCRFSSNMFLNVGKLITRPLFFALELAILNCGYSAEKHSHVLLMKTLIQSIFFQFEHYCRVMHMPCMNRYS